MGLRGVKFDDHVAWYDRFFLGMMISLFLGEFGPDQFLSFESGHGGMFSGSRFSSTIQFWISQITGLRDLKCHRHRHR